MASNQVFILLCIITTVLCQSNSTTNSTSTPSLESTNTTMTNVTATLSTNITTAIKTMEPTVDTKDICLLDPMSGPCKASVRRYFYNSTSKKCEMFTYGGCDGNKNNFASMEICDEKCAEKSSNTSVTVQPKMVTDSKKEKNTTVEPTTTEKETTVEKMTTMEPKTAVAGKRCGDPYCHVYSSCEASTNTCICPSKVIAVIDEICGSDGKTYQNEAKMQYKACKENESITKKYKGKCKDGKKEDNSKKKTIVIVIVVLIVFILAVVVIVVLYRRNKKEGGADLEKEEML